ncbi:MAG: hypothetical protein V1743_02510 [Nanoarchaeota archaeon]
MADLEYRIGGMDIKPDRLRFEGLDSYEARHKFVVEARGNEVAIYVTQGRSHKNVTERFDILENKVGGGSCYLNGENQLVLDDFSGVYKAIPKEVAQRFAELILPELEKLGVEVNGIAVNPFESRMNPYWIAQGFCIG